MSTPDDEHELLSNTDVEEQSESLMGDEKNWYLPNDETRQRSKKSSFVRILGQYRWLIDAFLLLVIAGLLLVLHAQWNTLQVGGDLKAVEPKMPTKVVKFEADMEYAPKNMSDFFTAKTLNKWKQLMPAGTGYGPAHKTYYTTSMTHQLHCVYMMTGIFSGIMTNTTKGLPEDYHEHFLHCVDYLRQSIMCSADLAMEAHDEMDSDDLGPLDGGWSGLHVCKDYSHVVGYLEEQIMDGVRVILPIDD